MDYLTKFVKYYNLPLIDKEIRVSDLLKISQLGTRSGQSRHGVYKSSTCSTTYS